MKEKERGDNNKKEDMKGKRQVHSGEKKSEVKKKKKLIPSCRCKYARMSFGSSGMTSDISSLKMLKRLAIIGVIGTQKWPHASVSLLGLFDGGDCKKGGGGHGKKGEIPQRRLNGFVQIKEGRKLSIYVWRQTSSSERGFGFFFLNALQFSSQ